MLVGMALRHQSPAALVFGEMIGPGRISEIAQAVSEEIKVGNSTYTLMRLSMPAVLYSALVWLLVNTANASERLADGLAPIPNR